MRKLIKFFFVVIFFALLSSCAIQSGYMNNSAALNQDNFSYTQQSISGSSEATYVFGIGGVDRKALLDEAKNDMLKDDTLQSNQALANVAVTWKNTFLIVVFKTKCIVTADIVEFN